MKNDPKPFGVSAGRLWFEAHLSRFDPKIAEPYASQIAAEIDGYIARVEVAAKEEERKACAALADAVAERRGAPGHKLAPTHINIRKAAAHEVASEIADAIRKRGVALHRKPAALSRAQGEPS